jgi:hypothetical protein
MPACCISQLLYFPLFKILFCFIALLLLRAAHPDRIFLGVHAQNEGGDAEPERDPIGGLAFTG